MSTFLRRYCAMVPVIEEAMSGLAPVATATALGTPAKISIGVIRKPPPTPNMPDRKPTTPPSASMSSAFTGMSAIGK